MGFACATGARTQIAQAGERRGLPRQRPFRRRHPRVSAFAHVVLATGARWRADGVGRANSRPMPGLRGPILRRSRRTTFWTGQRFRGPGARSSTTITTTWAASLRRSWRWRGVAVDAGDPCRRNRRLHREYAGARPDRQAPRRAAGPMITHHQSDRRSPVARGTLASCPYRPRDGSSRVATTVMVTARLPEDAPVRRPQGEIGTSRHRRHPVGRTDRRLPGARRHLSRRLCGASLRPRISGWPARNCLPARAHRRARFGERPCS